MALVHSLNVSTRAVVPPGRRARSGIGKCPVDGPLTVFAPGPKGSAGSGVESDLVLNRRHHGGDDQAVYAYAREDLDRWQDELGRAIPNGLFGENLTTAGVDIAAATIGETWLIGSAVLQVTEPRIPCANFAAVMGEKRWVRRFTERGDTGTYLRVLRSGAISAADRIEVADRPDHPVTVGLAFQALTLRPELMALVAAAPGMPAELRETALGRLSING